MIWQTRLFVFVSLVILGLMGCTRANDEQHRSTTKFQPLDVRARDNDGDGKVTLAGRIVENIRGCEIDVACVLIIEVDGFTTSVVYHFGEWPPCENIGASRHGEAVEAGEHVEVFAGIFEGDELTTCTSPEFYIHSILEP